MRLLVTVIIAAVLQACAPQQSEVAPERQSLSGYSSRCAVRIIQEGKDVHPVARSDGTGPFYALAGKPFRVEVSSSSCKPGAALVNREAADHLVSASYVFSGDGYWAAGDPAAAHLLASVAPGGNPRTTLDQEIAVHTRDAAWVRGAYDKSCKEAGVCPTVVKAVRTAWPFLDPATEAERSFAEFSAIDKTQPLSAAAGKEVILVLYTVEKEYRKDQYLAFHLLKPHVLRLRFVR